MSPKGIKKLISDSLVCLPVENLSKISIVVDTPAFLYFSLMKARKYFHEELYSIPIAVDAMMGGKRLYSHTLQDFCDEYIRSCTVELTKKLNIVAFVFDGGYPKEKVKEFSRRREKYEKAVALSTMTVGK